MNNAHTGIDAATGEQFCGYVLVRRLAATSLVLMAAMSAAHAGPGDKERERDAQRASVRAERIATPRAQQDQRAIDERNTRQFEAARSFDTRLEDQRRLQQEQSAQNADSFRRSGRLTPDERRDLRRQINEAGADIYQNKQRR